MTVSLRHFKGAKHGVFLLVLHRCGYSSQHPRVAHSHCHTEKRGKFFLWVSLQNMEKEKGEKKKGSLEQRGRVIFQIRASSREAQSNTANPCSSQPAACGCRPDHCCLMIPKLHVSRRQKELDQAAVIPKHDSLIIKF